MLRYFLWLFISSSLIVSCGDAENSKKKDDIVNDSVFDQTDTSKLGDWDTQPSLIYMPPIEYVHKNEGDVVLRIHTSVEGTVDTVWIIESSSHSELDSIALAQANRMVFRPAIKGGNPVSAQFFYPLQFRLR